MKGSFRKNFLKNKWRFKFKKESKNDKKGINLYLKPMKMYELQILFSRLL